MSSVVISEAFLTIAVIIAASIFSATFMANLQRVSDIERERTMALKRELGTRIIIILATAVGDRTLVLVWIKNVGRDAVPSSLIGPSSDLFFGPKGSFQRIPFKAPDPPTWNYSLVNDLDGDGEWDAGETIEVVIELPSSLGVGDYFVRYVAYTGAYDDYIFTVG